MLPDTIYIGTSKYQKKVSLPELWRVKHDIEMGPLWRIQDPQVHPMLPNQFSQFKKEWQLLSKELNPLLDKSRWTQCYGDATWIANRHGFGNPEDPRANYVTGENIGDGFALPKVELLTCGGNILTGHIEGSDLVADILDYRMAPPDIEWFKSHPWFGTWATRCGLKGDPVYLLQAKDANGNLTAFLHPLIGDKIQYPRITIPLYKLQKWTEPYLPDPMRIYL